MIYLIILISIFSLGFSLENSEPPVQKYRSMAYDIDSELFLYTENHKETFEENRIVKSFISYQDTNNIEFCTKEMTFNADSTKPNFVMKDKRDGYIEGSELLSDNRVRVFTRATFDDPIQEDTLEIDEEFVIDAGLTYFFRENWDELLSGEIISFYFVAPAKLDYFRFRVSKYDEPIIDGREAMTIELELNNWLLRQFVSSVFISYDKETKKILKYEGISNINNDLGKSHFVKIDF